ncbi:MAG: N-acetylmuramoyl-L-alanine amidase [Lachnospiraceae bacterium]
MEKEKRTVIMTQKKQSRWKKGILTVGIVTAFFLIFLVGAFAIAKFDRRFSDGAKKISDMVKPKPVFHALDDVKDADAVITKYQTYGTSLNLSGSIPMQQDKQIKKIVFVLRDAYAKADEPPVWKKKLRMEKSEDAIRFFFSEQITDGFQLEQMKSGDYCALLAVIEKDGTTSYHSFTDQSGENGLTYYTLTKNQSNQKVEFCSQTDKKSGLSYWGVSSKKTVLPDDVYDIVIDAGHGGTDCGAVNGEYTEAELTLEYALALQQSLERQGYKVCMTRDGTEDPSEKMAYTMYDPKGRVNVTAGSGAKYCLCLHLNSNEQSVNISGVQVYCTARGNQKMAKRLADAIVNETETSYSGMQTYKVADGVYQRAYTEAEIAEAAQNAQNAGYEPYDITTDTDYYYMIRETGGAVTNAYIDGRNTRFGKNEFLKSNQGVQTCLVEMGYISEDVDLLNLLNNKEAYVAAMTQAVVETAEQASKDKKSQ